MRCTGAGRKHRRAFASRWRTATGGGSLDGDTPASAMLHPARSGSRTKPGTEFCAEPMHLRRSLDQRLECSRLLPRGIILRAVSVQRRLWHPCRHRPPAPKGSWRRWWPSLPQLSTSSKVGSVEETRVPSRNEYFLPCTGEARARFAPAPQPPDRIIESPPPSLRFGHRGLASSVVVPTRPGGPVREGER